MPRACVIVLDAVGAGALPDAEQYGDEGSDTLGNVAKAVDRKSTRLNSSHDQISYAVFCLKKKKNAAYVPLNTEAASDFFMTRSPVVFSSFAGTTSSALALCNSIVTCICYWRSGLAVVSLD